MHLLLRFKAEAFKVFSIGASNVLKGVSPDRGAYVADPRALKHLDDYG
ncbi:hypothetical protein ACCI51_07565 [Microbulbifer echini]|uniref:Uncharacterized protein n=1 Tax=Microbulbifer echini TaxID=1529067 RepID=A0ABV4NLU9_9GAMM